MKYIKESVVYLLSDIRVAHPDMSIPDGADLSELGYYPVDLVAPPPITQYETLAAGEPEEYESGKWRETWVVTSIPVPTPTVVSMRQARLALLQSGLLSAVNAAIDAAETAVQIEWEYATEVQRANALVQSLSESLQLSETQLDELFTLAASL